MNDDFLSELLPAKTMDDEIRESFTPWFQDPVRLARLWRWLVICGKTPSSVPVFLEHAEEWQREYDGLLELEVELDLDGAA